MNKEIHGGPQHSSLPLPIPRAVALEINSISEHIRRPNNPVNLPLQSLILSEISKYGVWPHVAALEVRGASGEVEVVHLGHEGVHEIEVHVLEIREEWGGRYVRTGREGCWDICVWRGGLLLLLLLYLLLLLHLGVLAIVRVTWERRCGFHALLFPPRHGPPIFKMIRNMRLPRIPRRQRRLAKPTYPALINIFTRSVSPPHVSNKIH
jgi:hypothetical protein